MFNHCKPYKYNTFRVFSAVFLILLGILHASANTDHPASIHPRIALLGDSMTWIGGDSCQNDTGWTHILKESNIAGTIDLYARSGATWTNTKSTNRNPEHYTELLHDDNVVYNQAIRLIESSDTGKEEPDIVILFAGANDAWFAAKRPGIFDEDCKNTHIPTSTPPGNVTSLAGSVRLVSEMLHTRFPKVTLLFVTPLQMSKTDAETIFKISDIIEKTASEMGWSTLRADQETGICHAQEAKSPKYTYDGVHTNPAGASILGNLIVKFITSRIITDNL
ncbi:MAG: SGNH/GDSL hydrolase family protein [Muribaculaceae bacterium]|nr:SGNH/GDSL hydrolase family protein [Muribaculaceae bacterium]